MVTQTLRIKNNRKYAMKDAAVLCFGEEIRGLLFGKSSFSQKEEEIHPKVGFYERFL